MSRMGYSEREERRILEALGRSLLKDYPNPSRVGCPRRDVLQQIAARNMPLSEAGQWLGHLGSCSPCYAEFCEFRTAQGSSDTTTIASTNRGSKNRRRIRHS